MKLKPFNQVVSYLAETLNKHLNKGEKVLWLVPGGSLIAVAVEVAGLISTNPNLANLSVTLTDERYGEPGHSNENWQQLMDAGFSLPKSSIYRVLSGEGGPEIAASYSKMLESGLAEADYSIGLFGVGTDSHIAGIKPGSESVEASAPAIYYQGEDFERVTISFDTMRKLNEVVVAAKDEAKLPVVDRIVNEEVSLRESPAHILRQLDNVSLFVLLDSSE